MSDKILVTGPTGNVGREVVRFLLERGQPVVTAAVDERDAAHVQEGAEVRYFRFGDADTYPAAFEGVNKMFLMRPPQISNVKRYLCPVIDYAKGAGVEQLAFLSLLGIEQHKQVPHYQVECKLDACCVPYTFIRPSFYMQNLNNQHLVEIKERSKIAVPVSRARTSFVDVRDVGAVAALVLSEPGHENRFYELTGGEALDYYQVADLFRGPEAHHHLHRSLSVAFCVGRGTRRHQAALCTDHGLSIHADQARYGRPGDGPGRAAAGSPADHHAAVCRGICCDVAVIGALGCSRALGALKRAPGAFFCILTRVAV